MDIMTIDIPIELTLKKNEDGKVFSLEVQCRHNFTDEINPLYKYVSDLFLETMNVLLSNMPEILGRALTGNIQTNPRVHLPLEITAYGKPMKIILSRLNYDNIRLIAFERDLDGERIAEQLGEIRM